MRDLIIYTDGACSGNPGPGGWGALLLFGMQERELCGGVRQTTNNRMELQAAICALEAIKPGYKGAVTLYTDSLYVQQGICTWIKAWKKRGWMKTDKKPVLNADLWQRLDALTQNFDIDWRWVKGHDGNAGNERADALARQGLAQAQA